MRAQPKTASSLLGALLRGAALLFAASCAEESPDAPGTWEFFPDELVYNTPVGTVDVREFTIKNNGDTSLTIDISRPIGDGNCPEEPFLPLNSEVQIAGNSSVTLRVEHAPLLVPENNSCVYRVALTERANENQVGDPPLADRRSLRLDGGVRDVDADGDGWGRGEGDCNDRAIGDDPGDGIPGPASINPGAREACNGVDDDCDGLIDDFDVNEDIKLLTDDDPNNDPTPFEPLVLFQQSWHPDVDGDGFPRRSILPVFACEQPIGYVIQEIGETQGWDCNDQAFEIYPGAIDVAGEGIDRGCDGFVACFLDEDRDDWGGTLVAYPITIGNNFCQPLSDCETNPATSPCVSAKGGDCLDTNDQISPVASETCDNNTNIDEDCDGVVNDADPNIAEATQTIWYNDGDGDGEGNPLIFVRLCAQPDDPATPWPDWVRNAADCNDGNRDISTTATEVCDAIDNDCDGLTDDNDPGIVRDPLNPDFQWWIDRDNDLFGDRVNPQTRTACAQPLGYVNNARDCDDQNATINDFAAESPADGTDQNCDGLEQCWCDADSDSFGIRNIVLTRDVSCSSVSLQAGDPAPLCPDVANFLIDCNDNEFNTNPGKTEVCDGIDNDCDGLIDASDSSVSADVPYYRDRDGDGFGNPGEPIQGCEQPPPGFVPADLNNDGRVDAADIDCDDQNPAAAPNRGEIVANGVDENCDGRETCWTDADDDSYGERVPLGALGNRTDSEIGDLACVGQGVSSNQNDCDDGDAGIRPDAVERCDAGDADEDCDGASDDNDLNPLGTAALYYDGDGDGYGGNVDPLFRCDPLVGYATRSGDCNDASSTIRPGGVEVCNGFDDDCDGGADDNDNAAVGTAIDYGNLAASRASVWWPDGDGDGYGANGGNLTLCDAPPQYVGRSGDCDDDNPEVRAGAQEVVADGIDQNCDGDDDCRVDNDGDGFGSLDRSPAPLVPGTICEAAGYSSTSDDCDDSRVDVSPVAPEICDSRDNDCDRRVDDRDDDVVPAFDPVLPDAFTWLRDGDADGFGDQGDVVYACNQPVGYVSERAVGGGPALVDCNDVDRLVNPTASERVANGIDENCNGQEACYWDGDSDGFGVPNGGGTPVRETTNGRLDCAQPGYSDNTDDCADGAVAINPNAVEICDTVDNDCDSRVDDNDTSRVGGEFFYLDADGDGQGNPGQLVQRCTAPVGFVDNLTDCNDTNPNIFEGGREVCDALNVDEDCDGLAEDADDNEDNTTKSLWYADLDGDAEGDEDDVGQARCDPLPSQVRTRRDCNDSDPGVRPGASDAIADNLDSNCDGIERCYCNKDGDDFGLNGSLVNVPISSPPPPTSVCAPPAVPPGVPFASCTDPGVPVSDAPGDCDDASATTGLAETAYFLDADGDDYGNPNVIIVSCQAPPGNWVTNPLDCSDANGLINPDGTEICDPQNRDEDCDGFADDIDGSVDPGSRQAFRPDNDFDGFGDDDAADILKCDPAFNEVAATGDCDDDNAGVKPGAFDVVADDLDADCDGFERCYCNKDGDSFGVATDLLDVPYNPLAVLHACAPSAPPLGLPTASCSAPGTPVAIQPGDCDDRNAATGSSETLWFYDADGDGESAPTVFQLACTQPDPRWSTTAADCDDTNPGINTRGTEVCDPANKDEDCDGVAEDADRNVPGAPANKTTFYDDGDGDRYGEDGLGELRCDPLPTQVGAAGDCNDSNAAVNPAAIEVTADNLDSNCDGEEQCYCNRDGDAVGISTQLVPVPITTPPPGLHVCTPPTVPPASAAATCTSPGASVAILPGDCNDGDRNSTSGASLRFLDDDNDGRGNPDIYVFGCEVPAGNWVDNADDCNDANNLVYGPGGGLPPSDTCDGLDNDCDGTVDDGQTFSTWFYDGDGDGQGAPATGVVACRAPATGWVTDDRDCDDTTPAVLFAGGSETQCNGVDDDCDGAVDDGLARASYFYDGDNDGQGDPRTATVACAAPATGWITDDRDCDDTSSAILFAPGNETQCNNIDDDCDGIPDDGLARASYFYDGDNDGQGDPRTATVACAAPATGWITDDRDCDDTTPTILFAAGNETLCNNVDDDCDGVPDDGLARTTWFYDGDGDGQGAPATAITTCASPGAGWLADDRDCDDTSPAILAAAGNETVCNSVDDDCDGVPDDGLTVTTFFYDGDGDGQGDPATALRACTNPGTGWVTVDTDCDDTRSTVLAQAGNETVCNGVDDDCDGRPDDGLTFQLYALDLDGDTQGNPATSVFACASPGAGWVTDVRDCDDLNNTILFAAGNETVCNGADNDCDGVIDDGALTTFARDQDLDGRTPAGALTVSACAAPFGYTTPSSVPNQDCVDTDASIYPGAPERCDGVDQDCDTVADDAAIDMLTCQPDTDGDGFGAGAVTMACTCGAGFAANGDDCDDTEFRRYPGGFEVCDGVDDDCDTLVDNGASCGPDVVQLNLGDDGHSYLFVDNAVDWQTARDWCDARGYTLVRIETGVGGDEQTYLSFTASGIIGDTWWLAYAYKSCDADNEWDHYVGTTCVDDDAANGVNATEGADLPNGNPNDYAYADFDGTNTTWDAESIPPAGPVHAYICEELP